MERDSRTPWLALAAILAMAAALRFYALGTPEILHDEGLVANTARYGWRYIFLRSWLEDAHPPFFYLLTKAILALGSSPFVLRLMSAVAGCIAVTLLYRLGERLISRQAGLIAAALLSVHLLHVELSRALRPHSLIMALGILSFSRLLDFLEKPCRRNLGLLVLVNFALLLLHFNSVLIIGSEFAIVAAHALSRRGPLVKAGLTFFALTVSTIGVNAVFLVHRLNNFPGVQINVPMLWTLNRSLENLFALLTLFPFPWGGFLGLTALAIGAWRLWPQPRVLAMLAGMFLLPPTALVLARYGIIYHETHIAFILPFLLLVCASGLTGLARDSRVMVAGILILGGGLLVGAKYAEVYEHDAMLFGGGGSLRQREVARAIPAPGSPVVTVMDPFWLRAFIDWEYERQNGVSLGANTVAADDAYINYTTYLRDNEDYVGQIQPSAQPGSRTVFPLMTLAHWLLPHTPVRTASSLPARIHIPADPGTFFPSVLETSGLTAILNPLGNRMAPSKHGSEGSFAVRLRNASGRHAPNLHVEMNTSGESSQGQIEVSYRFDEEAFREAIILQRGSLNGTIHLDIWRDEPYSTLDIHTRLISSENSASFYSIPSLPAFNGMTVTLSPTDERFDFQVPVVSSQIDSPEQSGDMRYRWGNGPESILLFYSDAPQALTLRMEADSPIPGQRVEILLNGNSTGSLDLPRAHESASTDIIVQAVQGTNVLHLRYARWNRGDHQDPTETFAPQETRALAVRFTRLGISAVSPGTRTFAYFKEQK
jgi:hypothetical protein